MDVIKDVGEDRLCNIQRHVFFIENAAANRHDSCVCGL